jgi:hypothetical protein
MGDTYVHHSPAPRDFAPTPAGWAAIIIATSVLAWWVWRLGGERAGVSWLALSVIGSYVVAMMAWSAIRGYLDDRDGTG